jgi:hypothetical protein
MVDNHRELCFAARTGGRETQTPGQLAHCPVEPPAIGYAFQLVLADVLERQPAPGDEVLDGLGHQSFGRTCQTAHAGTDVDRHASDLAVNDIALAPVDPGADLDSKWDYRLGNRPGAAGLLSGAPRPMSIPDALRAAAPRPVLIIAGGAVPDEPVAARWFQAASPATVHMWVVPHAGHTAGLATAPAGLGGPRAQLPEHLPGPCHPSHPRHGQQQLARCRSLRSCAGRVTSLAHRRSASGTRPTGPANRCGGPPARGRAAVPGSADFLAELEHGQRCPKSCRGTSRQEVRAAPGAEQQQRCRSGIPKAVPS